MGQVCNIAVPVDIIEEAAFLEQMVAFKMKRYSSANSPSDWGHLDSLDHGEKVHNSVYTEILNMTHFKMYRLSIVDGLQNV